MKDKGNQEKSQFGISKIVGWKKTVCKSREEKLEKHKLQKCLVLWDSLTLWCPAAFGDFQKKKRLNARGFARKYLRSCSGYGPGRNVKRRGKSSCLHSKKNFLLGGCGFFVSDVTSGDF